MLVRRGAGARGRTRSACRAVSRSGWFRGSTPCQLCDADGAGAAAPSPEPSPQVAAASMASTAAMRGYLRAVVRTWASRSPLVTASRMRSSRRRVGGIGYFAADALGSGATVPGVRPEGSSAPVWPKTTTTASRTPRIATAPSTGTHDGAAPTSADSRKSRRRTPTWSGTSATWNEACCIHAVSRAAASALRGPSAVAAFEPAMRSRPSRPGPAPGSPDCAGQ